MFYTEGGETLAEVAQTGGCSPSTQVGPRGSEHPTLVADVPARCRGSDWMASEGPFNPSRSVTPPPHTLDGNPIATGSPSLNPEAK